MVFTDKDKEQYEYDLPGEPFHGSEEPMGQDFFSQPSSVPPDVKPFDAKDASGWRVFMPWIIGIILMLIVGGIFEFGILGKNGKQGSLCHSVFSEKICQVLAGPAPSFKDKR